jgi:predicted lipoprotein with Yx(FWY)xxD motif
MNKNTRIVIGVVTAVVVVVAGFALFHKSNKPASTATNSSNQNQNNNVNAPAVNNAVLTTKTDSTLGQYLADTSGKPLYTYNADTSGKSNCTGSCLANWPAYQAKGSTANLPSGVAVITRADNGQKQYTYNGMPLYYFTADTNSKPTGNGVEDFAIAKPAAASSSSPSTNSSSGYPY